MEKRTPTLVIVTMASKTSLSEWILRIFLISFIGLICWRCFNGEVYTRAYMVNLPDMGIYECDSFKMPTPEVCTIYIDDHKYTLKGKGIEIFTNPSFDQ
jgi:hypothetical protein